MSKPLIDKNGEAPELGDDFFKAAKRGRPAMAENERKQRVTLYLDKEIVEYFKHDGRGWQTRLNAALNEYRTTHK